MLVEDGNRGVTEGRAEDVRADGAFLSSGGRVQRDLTVAAINAFAALDKAEPDSLVVLDALSASGLRALRIALEVPCCKLVLGNDKSEGAYACMRANVEKHQGALEIAKAEIKCSCLDAAEAMASYSAARHRIDVIDIDPFGSPMEAIHAAVSCIRPGGLLSVAFFDLHVLCGNGSSDSSAACFARYGATPLKNMRCSHEIAVRIALASICKAAGCVGRSVEALMCAHMQSCVRILVRVHAAESCIQSGVSSSPLPPSPPLFYIFKCAAPRCVGWLTQEVAPTLGHVHVRDRPCEVCGAVGEMLVGGPIYGGPLSDQAFLRACALEVQAGVDKGTLQEGPSLKVLLDELSAELPLALFYHLPSLAQAAGVDRPPNRSSVLAELSRFGFRCSHSHCAVHLGLKTDAPIQLLMNILRGVTKAGAGCGLEEQQNGGDLHMRARKRGRDDMVCGQRREASKCSPDLQAAARGTSPNGPVVMDSKKDPEDRCDAETSSAAAAPVQMLNRRQRRLLRFASGDISQARKIAREDVDAGAGKGILCLEAGDGEDKRKAAAREGVLCVGEGEEFADVVAAVAVAAAGAIIRVGPGRYTCNLRLCKSLTIIGAGAGIEAGRTAVTNLVGVTRKSVLTVNASSSTGVTETVVRVVGCKLTQQDGDSGVGWSERVEEKEEAETEGREREAQAKADIGAARPGCEADIGAARPGCGRQPTHRITVNSGVLEMVSCSIEGGGSVCAVMVCGTGKLFLQDSKVDRPRGCGVCVCGKGEVMLAGSEVRGAAGPGIEVRGCGRAVVRGCLVTRCRKAGFFVHQNAAAELQQCHVASNGFAGVECIGGASALVSECTLADGLKGGVFIHSNGRAEVRSSRVTSSRMAGIHVKWGGSCLLARCIIEEGCQAGVLVEGSSSVIQLETCWCRGNRGHAVLAMDAGRCIVSEGVMQREEGDAEKRRRRAGGEDPNCAEEGVGNEAERQEDCEDTENVTQAQRVVEGEGDLAATGLLIGAGGSALTVSAEEAGGIRAADVKCSRGGVVSAIGGFGASVQPLEAIRLEWPSRALLPHLDIGHGSEGESATGKQRSLMVRPPEPELPVKMARGEGMDKEEEELDECTADNDDGIGSPQAAASL